MNTTANLASELERVINAPRTGYFTLDSGERVKSATESDVKEHLTSTRFGCYEDGRQYRFPGIANGWRFDTEIKKAGYHRVEARNSRGQRCQIVVAI